VVLRRSVAANVDYALRVRGVPRAERRRRRARVLEATGLAGLARRPARLLSGGEQQRLALARAWALEPQVLFLDEPAAGLDPAAQIALERAIAAVEAGGAKIVMTTHDLGQARRMAGEILFLHRGRLLEQGPAEAFFEDPRTAEAKAFLRGDIVP
jgi:tungstate transport system ATP-binding protein